jgi:hypothetical protein
MKRLWIVLYVLTTFRLLQAEDNSLILNLGNFGVMDRQDCSLMLIFANVWKHSPLLETEKAAWIVLNSSGQYESIRWPRTPELRLSVWSETMPKHVVAIAHTHGDHLDPRPSEQDVIVARKLNIVVFTLTRKGIWSVGPDGFITQQTDRGWFKRSIESCPRQ